MNHSAFDYGTNCHTPHDTLRMRRQRLRGASQHIKVCGLMFASSWWHVLRIFSPSLRHSRISGTFIYLCAVSSLCFDSCLAPVAHLQPMPERSGPQLPFPASPPILTFSYAPLGQGNERAHSIWPCQRNNDHAVIDANISYISLPYL